MQSILSADQIEAFYHDAFVDDQVRDFSALLESNADGAAIRRVTDMGGGCGFFAKKLGCQTGLELRVIDMDDTSVAACQAAGIDAARGDALNPRIIGDEDIVSFNLILHHLVGNTEKETLALQERALSVWRKHIKAIFVNEYIYESYFGYFSGRLIFEITKSPLLSWFGRVVSRFAPSLKANTFGVGVRFRASSEWRQLFEAAGYRVKATQVGRNETVSLPRRLLLIKHIRRVSFLLAPSSK